MRRLTHASCAVLTVLALSPIDCAAMADAAAAATRFMPTRPRPMIRRFVQHAACAALALCQLLPPAHANPSDEAAAAAQALANSYRAGAPFDHQVPVQPLVDNGRVAPAALALLAQALATGTTHSRQAIVRLLERAALAADRPPPDRLAIVRDRAVIRVLVTAGFVHDDTAASEAARVLLERCLPADLAAFHPIYLASLRQSKPAHVGIAARAKTPGALRHVERIARQPYWRDRPDVLDGLRIARAALGNRQLEDGLIRATAEAARHAPPAPPNRFYDVGDARDGTVLPARLDELGRVGTRRSLAVVCRSLRSPLKTYVADVSEHSVRRAAARALLYNYPDRRLLDSPSGVDEWREVERFCTRQLGVVFSGPTPDLAPPLPYPHH
ncbi:hypothetical protein [Pseudoduganella chitinolytica]|uniref:HEAT repeat domain-containing protein n=1 Tax=Pseudoduganella chitinolytica TaxID=34070 RepID=A0ABY8BFF2_9BURK|nr:hypothetical protein [Pseudoduganella chitinolytica]WEF34652.1 hypothetical protein PX653_07785 [Pseudoduganella chitinolytica]